MLGGFRRSSARSVRCEPTCSGLLGSSSPTRAMPPNRGDRLPGRKREQRPCLRRSAPRQLPARDFLKALHRLNRCRFAIRRSLVEGRRAATDEEEQAFRLDAEVISGGLHHGRQKVGLAPVDQHLGHAQPVRLSLPIHDFFSPSAMSVYGQQVGEKARPELRRKSRPAYGVAAAASRLRANRKVLWRGARGAASIVGKQAERGTGREMRREGPPKIRRLEV
jgi:hypothetical protein